MTKQEYELKMPTYKFKEEFGKEKSISKIAIMFKVSEIDVLRRAFFLKLINKNEYEYKKRLNDSVIAYIENLTKYYENLMPENKFRELAERGKSIEYISKFFNVPVDRVRERGINILHKDMSRQSFIDYKHPIKEEEKPKITYKILTNFF